MALFVSLCSLSAEEPKYTIDFKKVDTQQALSFYANLSGLELVTDSHVSAVHNPIALQSSSPSKSETMKLVEKALIEQAGIVITRLDDKKASVTFNDALPITTAKP